MAEKKTEELLQALEHLPLYWGSLAKHAADIAHTRRALFKAYLAEGFSEPQALELCKTHC